MTGRGAWPVSGLGGTKKYKDASKPGPYYYIGTGENADKNDPNQFAVHRAVMAYQRALNRRGAGTLEVDGVFGVETSEAVLVFQNRHPEVGVWGGIGPDTSRRLLRPDLRQVFQITDHHELLTVKVVSGTIGHESGWDAGAVGYTDERDVGLAQINAVAHPEITTIQKLSPLFAFEFVIEYYNNKLEEFGNLRDAIAAYNLGSGGARSWIKAGRPDFWTPPGSTTERNVKAYIDGILADD